MYESASDDRKSSISVSSPYNSLIEAVKTRQLCIVISYLLQHPEEINFQDDNGDTALHYAVHGWPYAMTELLILEYDAKLLPNKQGKTPLHIAVEKQAIVNVSFIISFYSSKKIQRHYITLYADRITKKAEQADLCQTDPGGNTPLHFLAKSRQVFSTISTQIAEILCRTGNEKIVDVADSKGGLPLDFIIFIIEKMTEHYNTFLENSNNSSNPLNHELLENYLVYLNFLIIKSKWINTLIWIFINTGKHPRVKNIIQTWTLKKNCLR